MRRASRARGRTDAPSRTPRSRSALQPRHVAHVVKSRQRRLAEALEIGADRRNRSFSGRGRERASGGARLMHQRRRHGLSSAATECAGRDSLFGDPWAGRFRRRNELVGDRPRYELRRGVRPCACALLREESCYLPGVICMHAAIWAWRSPSLASAIASCWRAVIWRRFRLLPRGGACSGRCAMGSSVGGAAGGVAVAVTPSGGGGVPPSR